MPRPPRHLLVALLVLALAAACGDDGTATTRTTATTAPITTQAGTTTSAGTTTPAATTQPTAAATSTTTPGTITTATTTPTPFPGDTSPKSGPAQGEVYGTLLDVRTAQREGFTRIVFDFGGTGVPEYDVRYQSAPFTNTADLAVPVTGSAFLRIRIFPARIADLNLPDAPLTYTGPRRFDPGTASVEEAVLVDDFEAVMIWVLGLTAEKPFAVGTLTGPPRLYVDITD